MEARLSHRRSVAILIGLFVASCVFVTPYLRGDGVGYYAWLRSAVMDGDLQFENEYRMGDPGFVAGAFDDQGRLAPGFETATGYVKNHWGVGAAVLWAPFFLLAQALIAFANLLGAGIASDGYGIVTLWVVGLGSALYAFVALTLSYRVASRFADPGAALVGTIAVWFASSLPVYQYFLPFWPFAGGTFAAAALVVTWDRHRDDMRAWRWVLMGTLCGLLVIVHPVGVAWGVLPILVLVQEGDRSWRQRARGIGLLAVGGVVGLLPQLIAKGIVYGAPFDTGYRVDWRPFQPDVLRVLFGARHGLMSWTPVAALAVVGLIWLWRKVDRRLGGGLLLVFLAMLYVISAYATPEESSYGNRFFVLFLPGFVIGGIACVQSVWNRRRALVTALAAALIVWNLLFAFQWAWGLIPKRDAVDWGQVVRQQFTTAPQELVRAVRLFVTDRSALIQEVQQRDLENVSGPGPE